MYNHMMMEAASETYCKSELLMKIKLIYWLNLTKIWVIKFYNAMVNTRHWKPRSLGSSQLRQQRC